MAIIENDANKNLIIKFLRFIESDSKGNIGSEQSSHQVAIRLFLEQNPFAMDLYTDFIKTSLCKYFPNTNILSDIINVANNKFDSFEQQSQYFCKDLWLHTFH
jgi:hypothetical protein